MNTVLTMSDKTYIRLKWIAQIVLPALASAYFSLGQLWGFPNVEQIVGTITILDLFLGAILGLSTASWNKSDAKYDGELIVPEAGDPSSYHMALSETPETLASKSQLIIKVQR